MDSLCPERPLEAVLAQLLLLGVAASSCDGLAPPRIMEVTVLSPDWAGQQEKWDSGIQDEDLCIGHTFSCLPGSSG